MRTRRRRRRRTREKDDAKEDEEENKEEEGDSEEDRENDEVVVVAVMGGVVIQQWWGVGGTSGKPYARPPTRHCVSALGEYGALHGIPSSDQTPSGVLGWCVPLDLSRDLPHVFPRSADTFAALNCSAVGSGLRLSSPVVSTTKP